MRMWHALLTRLAACIAGRGAHPARTVVLLPYAQLMPLARRLWAERHPEGFPPRFETSMNWARQAGFVPSPLDLGFDMARDLLAAREWLVRSGQRADADRLAPRLVQAAWQAAEAARAVPPQARPAWADRLRGELVAGLDTQALRLEALVARIALEWAAASGYASDALLDGTLTAELELLVVLHGHQAEPVAATLVEQLAGRAEAWPLQRADETDPVGLLALHEAADAEDEAERSAACVLQHLGAGRTPVALAATDRVLTRRVGALLADRGVAVRDATGWRLSTTRVAARVVAALRASAWDASCDTVLDWLKNAPACRTVCVQAIERAVRRAGVRDWRMLGPQDWPDREPVRTLVAEVARWREVLQERRTLTQWLAQLRELLSAFGVWQLLQADAAGEALARALCLTEGAAEALADWPQAGRRLDLREFTAWVKEVLEGETFVPPHEGNEPVVVLPMAQLLGHPFAAAVLPGCDERHLPAAPEPPDGWTTGQRRLLGLPGREALAEAQRAAWRCALQAPHCDILWRVGDDSGEPVLASPLVQALRLESAAALAADPRAGRALQAEPAVRPQVLAPGLVPAEISASGYEDLRRCPYRFYALRMLGLREADELEGEVGKRDFGTWLHAVLTGFHETLAAEGAQDLAQLLDAVAEREMQKLRLGEGEFLPFAAGWPAVRDAYLAWFAQRQAQGARFAEAEQRHELALGPWKLAGRIDRIDHEADGSWCVLDYKTEQLQATTERMKAPLEDTQLAFYAALLPGGKVRAAYLNISERGQVKAVPHEELDLATHLLKEGVASELRRIAGGAALPALGDGRACDFCGARGLCRKDWWHG